MTFGSDEPMCEHTFRNIIGGEGSRLSRDSGFVFLAKILHQAIRCSPLIAINVYQIVDGQTLQQFAGSTLKKIDPHKREIIRTNK